MTATVHADPRIVIAVLERAAEMLDEGFSGNGVLPAAMLDLGHDGDVWQVALWAVYMERPWLIDSRIVAHCSVAAMRATATSLRRRLASVALFCGALSGALDATRPGPDGAPVVDTRIRDLIAQHISGDPLAIVALRDLVEERCLVDTDHGAWAPEHLRQRWIKTGPHEHRWCPVAFDAQCTCGLYEHEYAAGWDGVYLFGGRRGAVVLHRD